MQESSIEARLKKEIENSIPGAKCLKFVSPGFTGIPDRIILLPHGRMAFAELKRPGQKEKQRQLFVQARLRRLGFTVFSAVDSPEKAQTVVDWARGIVQDGVQA